MKIAFIHQNCPGQFAYLAPFLASNKDNEVVFLTQPGKPTPAGVRKVEYEPTVSYTHLTLPTIYSV